MLENLSPDVVDGIREAMIDMLDREENALPMQCDISLAELDRGVAVEVEVVEIAKRRTIHVRRVVPPS